MTTPPIPPAALADCIAFIGKRGSGKSGAARGLAEAELAAGHRLCVIDPKGDWWGLRLTAAGQPSPWPVYIFGGRHGDIPIDDTMGEAIAGIVAANHLSCVVDLSALGVSGARRFARDFAETLYEQNRAALTLIVDEADQLAPQRLERGMEVLLHRMARLVKMGRERGIFMWMVSQRPAVLHNDLLSQCETLVAMRLSLPADKAAAKAWLDGHAEGEIAAVMASLPSLGVGEGWVCVGGDHRLDRVQFPMFASFDSSRTPKHGEAPLDDVRLGAIDLSAIRAALAPGAVTIGFDPGTPGGDLAVRTTMRGNQVVNIEPRRAGKSDAIFRAALERATSAEADLAAERDLGNRLAGKLRETTELLERARNAIRGASASLASFNLEIIPPTDRPERDKHTGELIAAKRDRIAKEVAAVRPIVQAGAASLGPERKPLAVLAGNAPAGFSDAAWATLAGFKRTGGTWTTYRGRLRTAWLVEQRDGLWHATDAGVAAVAGDVVEIPPPGLALVDFWAGKVPGAGRMLQLLGKRFPHLITREALAADLGMAISGGTFGTYLGRLRGNGLLDEQGKRVRIAPAIMEIRQP